MLVNDKLLYETGNIEEYRDEIEETRRAASASSFNATPENVEQGLAKLVLTLVELIRRLLEKQAIRRIEAGAVTDEEIERMGETFLRLATKMEELKREFGLEGEDLNLDLGPLGDLM
jgi:hypothetical protein